mmetsp:Transcript_29280/g.55509  ORF Transcript_29280/g.55509 Transcript_29280/m.55509 type:complete len:211 (-) Transcript_29280:441-1073(-)
MRRDENLVILIMQILPPVPRALQCSHHLMLLKLGLQIVQRKLPLLLVLARMRILLPPNPRPRNDQPILLRINVRHGQVTPRVKQVIRRDVILRQQFDPRLAIERLARRGQQIRSADRIGLEHVPEVRLLPASDGVLVAEVAYAMRFDPFEDVSAEVLAVDVPVGFEILSGRHEEAGEAAGMTLLEFGQVVHASSKRVPQGIVVVVFLDFL